MFNVTDDKGSINVILVDGLPAGATLLPTPKGNYTIEYTFRLELDEIADISLVFLATDDLDAGSTLEVQVCIIHYCMAILVLVHCGSACIVDRETHLF